MYIDMLVNYNDKRQKLRKEAQIKGKRFIVSNQNDKQKQVRRVHLQRKFKSSVYNAKRK